MSLDLYYIPPSAPNRLVLALGKELKIDFNLKRVNLLEKEHLKPEFLAVSTIRCWSPFCCSETPGTSPLSQ